MEKEKGKEKEEEDKRREEGGRQLAWGNPSCGSSESEGVRRIGEKRERKGRKKGKKKGKEEGEGGDEK